MAPLREAGVVLFSFPKAKACGTIPLFYELIISYKVG
jgi:hypothetical protein